ncbi:MAG: GNAT family N-acetyltransferase [Gammaproteobacteria bacterium]
MLLSRHELRTARLLLRRWLLSDRAPFAAMNADPQVMAAYPAPLTRAESDAFAARADGYFQARGFGLYAVEAPGVAPFIGFAGLTLPAVAHLLPAMEIAWRFARPFWGGGYATEACVAVLRHAFDELGVGCVMTYTTPENLAGRSAAARLGMTTDPADDFDHPDLPPGDPHRRRIVLKVTAAQFRRAHPSYP